MLAVSGTKRAASFPDVPMLARGRLPRPRNQRLDRHPGAGRRRRTTSAQRLNAAVNAAVGKPAINARLRQLGYEPHEMALAETGPFLTNSIETWRKMILATGMAIN